MKKNNEINKIIPLVKTYISPKEEMMPAIEKILYSGYIAVGEAVAEFESSLGDFIDNRKVVALNSGTAALHIAMLLAGVTPGDEVISTAMTAEPTNTSIVAMGARVVWADVDYKTGLISPDSIREKITEKTKAIIVVHYAGMVCNMDEINRISKDTGIPIIEDAAHSFGSKYNGKIIGSNSPYTCYSFQAIKQLTTVDGGAISVLNEDDINEIKKYRWFGLDKSKSRLENDIKKVGFKYGMNNVNATIGSVQLNNMPSVLNKYIENGKYYDCSLANIAGVTMVPYYNNTEPSYWLYTMKVEDRDSFCRMMEEAGITASPLHHRSDTHSIFAELKCDLPNLDKWYKEFVHIPCGWWVENEDREYIVDTIKKGW